MSGRIPPQTPLGQRPRHVPFALRMRLRTGGILGMSGWATFAIGSILAWVFIGMADVAGLWQFSGPLDTYEGTVRSVERSNMKENSERVYRASYEFVDDEGGARTGSSYGVQLRQLEPGESVTIETAPSDPSVSRIVGARRKPFPGWVVFVAIVPVVGLVLAIGAWVRGARPIRLLAEGEPGHGKLVSSRETAVQINERRVVEHLFEYTVDGQTHRVSARTHTDSLRDDALEPLLYDPRSPARATLVDHLPGNPRIDSSGQLQVSWGGLQILAVALPAVAIAGNVICALILL